MILKIFGTDNFFNCEATNYAASCIGRFKATVILKALTYKFEVSVTTNGYIRLTRGCCSITLTD